MRTLVALLVLCAAASATTVTGKAVDPNGNPYTGTISAYLFSSSTPIAGGKVVNPSLGPLPLAADGSFTISVTGTDTISPSGSVWQFTFCGPSVPNSPYNQSQAVCFNTPALTIAGGAVDITSSAASNAKILGPRIVNIGFNPNTVVDPWKDVRTFGVDCTGVADSRAAFVAALTSGYHRILAPPDCKINIQASGGLGAVISGVEGLTTGWVDIYGGDGAEIFGCGAGSGAVLKFDRSGYFKFHGFTTQLTDFAYCAGGSTFTRQVDWTNSGVGGVTSTKARFYDLLMRNTGLLSGGNWFVNVGGGGVVADNGNLVAYVDTNPSWTNLGIHQDTATTIANGTLYTLNAREALANITFNTGYRTAGAAVSVNLTANSVIVATTTCTPVLATWNTCTVQYTGTVGTTGQALGVTLLNGSTVPVGGAQQGSGYFTRVFFDNLTSTNFAVTNPSFETLVGGATLTSPGSFINPSPGASWAWVQGAASYPLNIALQVGGFGGDQNLEGLVFSDSDIDGEGEPNSYGFLDQGCCSEHAEISNIGLFNIWRGIYGAVGGTLTSIHGGGSEGANQFNYQVFGVGGGGLVIPTGCAGSLTLVHPTWDGFGPILGWSGAGEGSSLCEVTIVDGDLTSVVTPSTGYTVDTTNSNLTLVGGHWSNITGAVLPNAENAIIGMEGWNGNSCCGFVAGSNSVHPPNFATPNDHGTKVLGNHLVTPPLVFSCPDTGIVNAYVCGSYFLGAITYTPQRGDVAYLSNIQVTNTASSTLAVQGSTAKTIKKTQGTANLGAGDLQAGGTAVLIYDGTNWQLH